MKTFFVCVVTIGMLIPACSVSEPNPFDTVWDTPFSTPPFDKIKTQHYKPAMLKGIELERKDIEDIVNNLEAPTFENTIGALDYSGEYLARVRNVFNNMTASMSDEEMRAIDQEMAPVLSAHRDDILLNESLFERVKSVWNHREDLTLTSEQLKLLDETYKLFVRNGANLNEADKTELRKINEELSVLAVRFGDNILKENNRFELVIDREVNLAGLPDAVISAASETAKERGYEGKWVFTIHKPSLIPFLQYSEKRDLREKMFTAYIMKGNHGDDLDNNKICSRMASLRVKKAELLGYETHAHLILEKNMAKNPENVYELLNQLWEPALKRAKSEAKALQAMIDEEGGDFELKPWDWWYYAEKVKRAKYDLDEEMLRPYFQLENVRQGVFDLATKLWGLQFVKRNDISKYHRDVDVFEVQDEDGTLIGVLYTDYFPRDSKQGGAWMDNFRQQYKKAGTNIRPIVVNVGNFAKPTADKPSLLSLEEVTTLFHEFGHALHGLLSQCSYVRLSGTNVPRDYVELPSQFMENWALTPEIMRSYARHYQTNKPIPDELVAKIRNASLFNQGFETTELLAAMFLDMDWHTLSDETEQETALFDEHSMDRIHLIPEIVVRYKSPYFAHIFSGGYSAGYYSYIWAAVLDSDAFQAFKEAGLFNKDLAMSYRKNILESGSTEDPMVLYKRFRGAPPKIDALLEKRGLK